MKLFRFPDHCIVQKRDGTHVRLSDFSFDELFRSDEPAAFLENAVAAGSEVQFSSGDHSSSLPPIGSQEVWAAGVTYFRSREARMEEAESSGGDVFYDLVYDAERPELFFKATDPRVRGHGAPVRIREDSTWDVPEPELTLAVNHAGEVFGYSVGNDMSSRSIEGENPLYLPQAKVYRGSCAIGPCLVVDSDAVTSETEISVKIIRAAEEVFSGATSVSQIKRGLEELVEFLFRENEFPDGAYLMTGTGVVPDSDFTLQSGDVIEITISGIGTLRNEVE